MKVALLGYGKMGHAVEEAALSQGDTITSIKEADVCIDFSHADAIEKHITLAAQHKLPLVIGTTGWDHSLLSLVREKEIPCVYSPNFSVGIHVLHQLSKQAARTLRADTSIHETHHQHKVDAPSGTALSLQNLLETTLNKDVPTTFTRSGEVNGIHTVTFTTPFETLTLNHEAKNRQGFAQGALLSARWIQGKTGIHTFQEVLFS